jgi:molecular chaperone IbpA
MNIPTHNFTTSVGLDKLLSRMHQINTNTDFKYPPYNILRVDDYTFRIEIAVAGFNEDELEVEFAEDVLKITGQKPLAKEDDPVFLHKGISDRSFKRSFVLSPDVIIGDVSLEDGLLKIVLEREIPEHKKPRKIPISKADPHIREPELLMENLEKVADELSED